MFAIGMEIEEVVENIESRGAEAVEREACEGADQRLDREVVGQSKGQEEQKILRPVVSTKGIDPRADLGGKRIVEKKPRLEDRALDCGNGKRFLGTGFRA